MYVLFIFNFRYYDNHFLVCGICWIKSIWFFSFVFAAPPVISRRSHTLRRRAVGQIFPHGRKRALNLEENLIPCEQVSWERNCCQGGLGFNQNEWALRKSWNSLLEQLRRIYRQLDMPFLKWGVYFDNTSAIQKYLKIPISNYFKCFLLPLQRWQSSITTLFAKDRDHLIRPASSKF